MLLADQLAGLRQAGLAKDDPTVRRMLALRQDIFNDYSETAFATVLGNLARIEHVETISQSGRKVYWYDRS